MKNVFQLIGLLFFCGCAEKHSAPETYLIPDKLNGHFAVVYGMKCGIAPETENGRRLLRIPDDGVLLIQPAFEAGIVDHEYYSVDSAGRRTKMNMIDDLGNTSQYPGAYLISTGTFNGNTANEINYNDFVLARKGDKIDTVGIFDDHSFENVVDSVIKTCK